MFWQLVASRPDPAGAELKRGSAVSLLAHGLVVAGALWATVRPQATAPAAAPVVITWPDNPITPVPDGPQLPAGMAGRVIVQAVIDTNGSAEPGSVIVVESPDSGFDEPARTYVLTAQFRPGRVRGRPVRVLVRVPIEFALSRSR